MNLPTMVYSGDYALECTFTEDQKDAVIRYKLKDGLGFINPDEIPPANLIVMDLLLIERL